MVWKLETQVLRHSPSRPPFTASSMCEGALPYSIAPGKSPLRNPAVVELGLYGHSREACEKGGGISPPNVTRVINRNLRHLAHQEQGKQAWNRRECATLLALPT